MTKTLTLLALGLSAVALTGCGTSDDMPTAPRYSAPADLAGLQDYAAIGNSLTAGYQSGAWGNPEHVAASFPNLIARQLGIAGFKQVGMAGTGLGFVSGNPVGNMVVNFTDGSPVLSYSTVDMANVAAMQAGAAADFDFSAPRNFGIPGITLMHSAGASLDAYFDNGLGNPYANFYRNAASGSKTQVQLTAESGAGFITCWLGNNDVLGFVTSGGTGAITPEATFQASLSGVSAMLGSTPYLAVMNVPKVTDIPFVTYMNTALAAQGVQNLFAVVDGDTTLVSLAPGSGNFVLLSASGEIALGKGTPNQPLLDQYVLDAVELAAAQAAVESFNDMLAAMVDGLNAASRDYDVVLVDMNAFFTEVVANGVSYAGETFTTRFVSGGLFSLDGVHPTSLGYAVLANRILEDMGEEWNLHLEPVDLAEFIGVNNGLGSWEGPLTLPDFQTVVELFQH